ncbi:MULTISPECIES: response regulator transcription factor [unclassified Sphingomonas]|uniref:response regulator transcription factor n=1 Tax=unclassified Sphingomonas TaxID=196159 RepID=UPI000831255A|nr:MULTISPECIES: response regulator transcription factor [unclassified Sphingomonas]
MARLILAEDDEILGRMVSDALGAAGHAVGWLVDGQSAWDAMLWRPPHLAILDCNLPRMTGITILRQMRVSQTLVEVPVIMLTGRRGAADQSIARYEGANDYVTKPFDMPLLLARVNSLLERSRRWH